MVGREKSEKSTTSDLLQVEVSAVGRPFFQPTLQSHEIDSSNATSLKTSLLCSITMDSDSDWEPELALELQM